MEGILLNMTFKDLSIFLHPVEKTFALMININIYEFVCNECYELLLHTHI